MFRKSTDRPTTVLGAATAAIMAAGMSLSLGLGAANAAGPHLEQNTDRRGADYRVFAVGKQGPTVCANECARDAQCKSWTHVLPYIEGPEAMCHLKSTVPLKSASPCCTSGVTVGAGMPGGARAYITKATADQ